MKNTEKAAIPMSPMPKVVFMPRRLSGNRSKQPRSDPSRESSRPTHPTKRIRGFLRIPYFGAAKRFTPTVVFATHRRCRDSDSIALRTAAVKHNRLHFQTFHGVLTDHAQWLLKLEWERVKVEAAPWWRRCSANRH